jgi:hypothetical protein
MDESTAPVTSDNDELAKVLAGIGGNENPQPRRSAVENAGLQFEETPAPGEVPQPPVARHMVQDGPAIPSFTPSTDVSTPVSPAAHKDGGLSELKKSALEELRPLVTKLNLPPDEKFDTLLLIIRSTDDKSLLAPAHEAAKLIVDETRRAQALLDIIKEIDYFGEQAK